MNVRALCSVCLRSPEDLAGHRSNLPDTKEEEAEEVDGRMAFCPLEIDVRLSAGLIPDVDEQCCESVWHSGTLHGEYPVLAVHHLAVHVEPGGELGWVLR